VRTGDNKKSRANIRTAGHEKIRRKTFCPTALFTSGDVATAILAFFRVVASSQIFPQRSPHSEHSRRKVTTFAPTMQAFSHI
jgi:hypothetical protein